MRHLARLGAMACALGASNLAGAQPAQPDKVDAQSLVKSGAKLIEAKDYLGALAVFKDAYARFPSPKILLDIGITLKLLERDAEAANAYQGYLDAPDADPARRPEVQRDLDALDARVGLVTINVTPPDAEVQVGDEEWAPAARVHVTRVSPGAYTVRARKAGFRPGGIGGTVAAAAHADATLTLTAIPREVVVQAPIAVAPAEPESRFGAYVGAHFDLVHEGGAALLGGSLAATDRLSLRAAAIIGPAYGAYAGASFALLRTAVRPTLSAGVPLFFSSGARVGVRGAAGIEIAAGHRLVLCGEVGVEHYFNPQMDIVATVFVPALGVLAKF